MGSYSHHDDAGLVALTLRGSTEAYRELIGRYRNAAFGLAVSILGDFDRADDAAQDAFIQMVLRETDMKDLGDAIRDDNEDTEINHRLRANVSERVWDLIHVHRKHHPAPDERCRQVRTQLVELVHKLQSDGAIRPAP